MADDHRRTLGRTGEDLAAEHLVRAGFEIVERNFRTRWGELDIVAYDGRTLVFCEVKSRRVVNGDGHVFDALHGAKRAQVRKMAGMWLSERDDHPRAVQLRFDAVGVTFDRAGQMISLEHLEGAF
jgi:putative endonuclease